MEEEETPRFAGFRRPETEFYSTPNEWTDITADIDNLAELKIIEYIMRHTWGFKEQRNGKWVVDYDKPRKISTDEFMHGRKRQDGSRMDKGTKLSKQSVLTGIEKALEHGYIEYGEKTAKANTRRSYRLKLVQEVDQSETKVVKDLDQSLVKELDQFGLTSRPNQARMKETPETQLHKETLKERPSSRASLFTSEQLRIDALYCALSDVAQPPQVTDHLKKYWDKLAQYITTQEEMISLYDHTKRDCATKKNKRVYPGNLADCVIVWHQEEEEKRTQLPWSQPNDSAAESAAEEPEPDEPIHAGKPLFYWTEETMAEAELSRNTRRAIRSRQQEYAARAATERVAV